MKALYKCKFCKYVEFADVNIVKKHVNRCKNIVAKRLHFADKNYLEKGTTSKSTNQNSSENNNTFSEFNQFRKKLLINSLVCMF